jgi:hypothetical protein
LTKTTDTKCKTPKHLSKESADFFRKTVVAYELDDHHILLLTKAMEAQTSQRSAARLWIRKV